MIKRLLSFLLIVLGVVVKSQTYPYLNASTANENEFPVDKDTNIYMFHDNRLVKTDKNFNVIWANTYNGITGFNRLLLSKTGSIYFVSNGSNVGNVYFGKLNSDGSFAWAKDITTITAIVSGTNLFNFSVECKSIFLDRNNHLVVTGSEKIYTHLGNTGFLLKLDTNGVPLKFKCFRSGSLATEQYNLSLVNDSLGFYKMIAGGYAGIGPASNITCHVYDDNTDSFLYSRFINSNSAPEFKLMRSKNGNNFYLLISNLVSPASFDIYKYKLNNQIIWGHRTKSVFGGMPYPFTNGVVENTSGELISSFHSSSFSLYNYTTGCFKIDSNGISNNNGFTMLKNYFISFTVPSPMNHVSSNRPQALYGDKYYFDVVATNYPANPLTIQDFSSISTFSCTTSTTCFTTIATPTVSSTLPIAPVNYPITSYAIKTHTLLVNAVTFSANPNYCSLMNVDESSSKQKVTFSPNPAHSKIVINASDKIESVEVYDISGKLISTHFNTNEIEVSELTQGMYFLRMNFGDEIITKKFIKN